MKNPFIGSRTRRRFLRAGILGALAGLFARKAVAETASSATAVGSPAEPGIAAAGGVPLRTRMRLGDPPVQPLDSMVTFERGDDNNGRAMTHEVLSLIHEEKGRNSYPWTLYASLDTHHEAGDACVVCARLHKHGVGWSSGLHSEVFNHARGVALGVNIETSNDYAGPDEVKVIGLNIQDIGPKQSQYGIQVHGDRGGYEKAVGLNGAGPVGLDVAGKYDTGIAPARQHAEAGRGRLRGAGRQGRDQAALPRGPHRVPQRRPLFRAPRRGRRGPRAVSGGWGSGASCGAPMSCQGYGFPFPMPARCA